MKHLQFKKTTITTRDGKNVAARVATTKGIIKSLPVQGTGENDDLYFCTIQLEKTNRPVPCIINRKMYELGTTVVDEQEVQSVFVVNQEVAAEITHRSKEYKITLKLYGERETLTEDVFAALFE